MKVYLQSAILKRVIEVSDIDMGANIFIMDAMRNEDDFKKIGHLVIASDYGYVEDIVAVENHERLKEVKYIPTYDILRYLAENSPCPDESAQLTELADRLEKATKHLFNNSRFD